MIINDAVLDLKRYVSPFGSADPPAGWHDNSRYENDMTDGAGAADPDWLQLPSGMWVKDFDGNDYGTIAYSPSWNQTETITVLLWYYATNKAADRFMIGLWNVAGEQVFQLRVLNTSGFLDVLVYQESGATEYSRVTGAVDVTGGWHLGGFTVDGTNLILYNDGLEVDTDGHATGLSVVSQTLWLGSRSTATWMLGQLGLPRMWSYALNPNQMNDKFTSERHWFDGA